MPQLGPEFQLRPQISHPPRPDPPHVHGTSVAVHTSQASATQANTGPCLPRTRHSAAFSRGRNCSWASARLPTGQLSGPSSPQYAQMLGHMHQTDPQCTVLGCWLARRHSAVRRSPARSLTRTLTLAQRQRSPSSLHLLFHTPAHPLSHRPLHPSLRPHPPTLHRSRSPPLILDPSYLLPLTLSTPPFTLPPSATHPLHLLAVDLDVVAHVVLLGQVEHAADLGGALGAALARLLLVGQPGQLALACVDGGRGGLAGGGT